MTRVGFDEEEKKNFSFDGYCCTSRLLCEEGGKVKSRNKYMDLARELIKLWKMIVTVLLTFFAVLGTVNKVQKCNLGGDGDQ